MVVVIPFSRTYYVFLPIIVPRTEVQKLVTNYKETMKCDGYKSKMDRCLSNRIDVVDVNQMCLFLLFSENVNHI